MIPTTFLLSKFPPKYVLGRIKSFLGKFICFWGRFWEIGLVKIIQKEVNVMRKKNYKGCCTKRMLSKSKEVVRTYDPLQYAYADILQKNENIREFQCNVFLDGLQEGKCTSDFVCIKTDGDIMIRECVQRKLLMKPMTITTSGYIKEPAHNRNRILITMTVDNCIFDSGAHILPVNSRKSRNNLFSISRRAISFSYSSTFVIGRVRGRPLRFVGMPLITAVFRLLYRVTQLSTCFQVKPSSSAISVRLFPISRNAIILGSSFAIFV